MLDKMRGAAKSWVAKILIGLLVIVGALLIHSRWTAGRNA